MRRGEQVEGKGEEGKRKGIKGEGSNN